jgi:hypothetical protein
LFNGILSFKILNLNIIMNVTIMSTKRSKANIFDPQLRQHLAQTSARLMVQEGINDYHIAKCKAATQLGIPNTKHLPSNSEIAAEILIYQRLFHAENYSTILKNLRQVALEAMRLFVEFKPRLVDAVLAGTVQQHSPIILHLFAYSPEEVAFFLIEKSIPYTEGERRFRLPQIINYPYYQFVAGEETVVLIVFNINDIRWSPPSPIDGKPMQRADVQTVEQLLKDD